MQIVTYQALMEAMDLTERLQLELFLLHEMEETEVLGLEEEEEEVVVVVVKTPVGLMRVGMEVLAVAVAVAVAELEVLVPEAEHHSQFSPYLMVADLK